MSDQEYTRATSRASNAVPPGLLRLWHPAADQSRRPRFARQRQRVGLTASQRARRDRAIRDLNRSLASSGFSPNRRLGACMRAFSVSSTTIKNALRRSNQESAT
jgi:hypothetical protein